jgi:hypothetical protein
VGYVRVLQGVRGRGIPAGRQVKEDAMGGDPRRLTIRAILDQEIAEAADWMMGSDPARICGFRHKLADDDSAAMVATLTPDEVDVLVRLAIIGFDEVVLKSEILPEGMG